MTTNSNNTVLNVAGLIVAFMLTVAFMFVTYTVMEHEIPEKNHDLIVFVLGFLTAQIGAVIQFYYGSSSATRKMSDTASSQAETINNLTPTQPDSKTVTIEPNQTATVKAKEPKT